MTALKRWTAGDALTAADLNLDFGLLKPARYFSAPAAENFSIRDALCAGPFQSDGGIKLDARGTSTTVTTSITIGNHTNRYLVIFVLSNKNYGTPTVTFNGVTMTAVDNNGGGYSHWLSSFVIPAPPIGTYNLVVTIGGGYQYTSYYSIYNASQSTSLDAHAVGGFTHGGNIGVTTVANGAMVFGAATTPNGWGGPVTAENTQSSPYSGDSGQVFPAGTYVYGSIGDTYGAYETILVLSIAPVTAPAIGIYKATSAAPAQTWSKYLSFIGFADATVTAGNTANALLGGVVTGFSNLVAGAGYYLNDAAGTIGTSQGTNMKKVGIAVSTSELLITNI
jgi:hypothetical protein